MLLISPTGSVELEEIIPDWLRTVTGFPDTAKGVLYNDSCSADMLCLFTARCTRLPDPNMYERCDLYQETSLLITVYACVGSLLVKQDPCFDPDSAALMFPSFWLSRAVVYGSEGSLLAISQPLHILGLSHCQKSVVDSVDENLAIRSLMKNIQCDLQVHVTFDNWTICPL